MRARDLIKSINQWKRELKSCMKDLNDKDVAAGNDAFITAYCRINDTIKTLDDLKSNIQYDLREARAFRKKTKLKLSRKKR